MAAGMTSAITNPVDSEIVASVMAADVLMGHDPNCTRWIARHRVTDASVFDSGRARRRRRRV